LVIVIVGASLAGMLFNLLLLHWHFIKKQDGQITVSMWTTWLQQAFPFFFVTVFYTLDYQLDTVLLSLWQSETAVGIYGAATTVLFVLLFIPQSLREAIFPAMARLYPENLPALRKLYCTASRWLLAAALPIVVGGTLIARDLMTFVYQEAFYESGRVLQIMLWSLLLLFINVPNNRLLIVAGKQREVAWFTIISTSVNVLLNAWLIPRYSYVGAAVARLVSTSVFFILTYAYTYRHLLRFNLLHILARPVIAAVIMG
jgi:O-antigen/teichoic acid export membrane protein